MNNENENIDISTKLTEQETEFVIDGLVHLILQAERELVKFRRLKDKETRDHVCNYELRKLRSLRELKEKFKITEEN
jgi:hypothetical protein